MEELAYILAILIGVSLGLIGGGGSVLTVPILVYFLGIEAEETAPAYSLFVVGTASLIGAVIKHRNGLVDLKTAFFFGAPAVIVVYLTRRFLVPSIPDELFVFQNFVFTKRMLVMGLFSILMILASLSMIRQTEAIRNGIREFNYLLILVEGVLVGVLTGLIGAGGGFIIIPALVMLSNLPMKKAIGTSLAIIAAKSLIGFLGDLSVTSIDWEILLGFTVLAVVGIFIGNSLSQKIDGGKLKKGFGGFVLVIGIVILIREVAI